ncbi:MAG: GntR family transcriptional regulator [Anaerolineaceae bacterium]|nr:GntR family transcriptional regulator [Anaerolineaceae bacterium]
MNVLEGRISLDFRAEKPLYLQIVRQIENLVVDGIIKPGDQLPTVRSLAIDLRINFSTVARAYRILDEQKLISTQRGRGTYIWDEISEGNQAPIKDSNLFSEILVRITENFFRDAFETGASLEDIEQEIYRQLEYWKNNK